MCWMCFKSYTDEPVVNEDVVRVAHLIKDAGDDAHWGFLHIYVEDVNLDDHYFAKPSSYMTNEYRKAQEWERHIFDELTMLSEAERATAIAMAAGWIEFDGTEGK